jgi:L-asparaginase II
MNALPGWLVVKGGAEGLRGVGILPGGRGRLSQAAGLALSVEDGDAKNGRAASAVSVEALRQVGVLDDRTLEKLSEFRRPRELDPQGRPASEAVPRFELAPVSELV